MTDKTMDDIHHRYKLHLDVNKLISAQQFNNTLMEWEDVSIPSGSISSSTVDVVNGYHSIQIANDNLLGDKLENEEDR
jgi:hypothetical protein